MNLQLCFLCCARINQMDWTACKLSSAETREAWPSPSPPTALTYPYTSTSAQFFTASINRLATYNPSTPAT